MHIHIHSRRKLSFLEWACAVFHKSWLDVCMQEAAKAGAAAGGAHTGMPRNGGAAERKALYDTRREAAEAQERAEGESEMRELARRRAELRKRGERFERLE